MKVKIKNTTKMWQMEEVGYIVLPNFVLPPYAANRKLYKYEGDIVDVPKDYALKLKREGLVEIIEEKKPKKNDK